MNFIKDLKKLAYTLTSSQKLEIVPIGESWFEILKDKEKEIIRKLIEIPKEDYFNKDFYTKGNWAINMFHEINDLLPFDGSDRSNILSWLRDAQEQGLISPQEESRLIRFCIDQLYF